MIELNTQAKRPSSLLRRIEKLEKDKWKYWEVELHWLLGFPVEYRVPASEIWFKVVPGAMGVEKLFTQGIKEMNIEWRKA